MLQTERLFLQPLTDDDYVRVLRHGNDDDVMRLCGVKHDEVAKEREKAERGFCTFNRRLLVFGLIEKSSGNFIGWCGYHTWYLDHARAELGYVIFDEAFRKKGYMGEALKAVLEHGFNTMKLKRVEALIGPSNTPSLNLIKRFGFSQEGVLREHYFTNGRYEDSLFFGLLEKEYRDRNMEL